MRSLTALLMLFASALCLAQADYTREKRRADEITPAPAAGDPAYLETRGGHKFLALYTPSAQSRAAVIIVHGLGAHPDRALISTLRSQLAKQGYATLSVQMPALAAGAKDEGYPPLFPDAAQRLQAAVAFLKAQGHDRIAIVSHGMGARMANYYLTSVPDNGIAAWASLGISNGEFGEPGKLRAPILDLYGENDLPQVVQKADARAEVLRKLKGSAQIQFAGADHDFSGHEAEMVNRVRQFLDQKFR